MRSSARASAALVENIKVDYYGTPTELRALASISVPEARVLLIQPYDENSLQDVEKAILKSDQGLVPNNDGTAVRINIPQLTEERRRDLVKLVGRRVEESNVAIRNIRRDSLQQLRTMEKAKDISQDEFRVLQEQLQKIDSPVPGLVGNFWFWGRRFRGGSFPTCIQNVR